MYKHWKTLVVAALFFCGACLVSAGETTTQHIYLDFEGEVLDTDMGISLYREGQHHFKFVIDGLTIRVDSYEACSSEPIPPFCVGYMEKKKNKLSADANPNVGGDDAALAAARQCLANHRKAAGFGVHGPLKIKGTILLSMSWKENKPAKIRPTISFVQLEGPKGSWSK